MRCFGLLLIASLLFANTQTVLMAQEHTALTVTRLYTGQDGQSHFERLPLKFSPRAGHSKSIEQSEISVAIKSYIVRAAPGYFESWHNADVRRYVIPISGRAEIEIADGQKFAVAPGTILLAEDLTGKGHIFRVVGDVEWVALFLDLGNRARAPH